MAFNQRELPQFAPECGISQFYTPIMIVLVILIGFFIRLYHLNAVPLRGDEAFTVQFWARQPFADTLARTATMEPHPVLTYALFRAWGLAFGTTEFPMRMLPALANVLGIAALYTIGRLLGGKSFGLLAALLFALHPYEIWHAQDARNYAIWAGTSAVTIALGLRALRTERKRHWLAYAVVAAITANIFYFEWFTIVAFGLYVLICCWRQWRIIGRWTAAVAPAVLTSAASFLVLQGNLVMSGSYSGNTALLNPPDLLTWFLPTLSFGETVPRTFAAAIWPFVALALLGGLILLWQNKRRNAILLGMVAFVPLLLLAAASSRVNIFNPRYMLSAVPGYILIFAALIEKVGSLQIFPRMIRPVLLVVLLVAWLGVVGYSLYDYFFVSDYAKTENWPALTDFLAGNVTKDDIVIQLSVDPAFGYYYHAPAQGPALPVNPSQPADEIRSILNADSTQYRTIWVVGQTPASWPNVGIVEDWLNAHMQMTRGGQIGGLNYYQYLLWQVNPDEIQIQPLANFGDLVDLMAFQTYMPPDRNGSLTVWLYWRPRKTNTVPLKVFVHLIGLTNPATGTPLWTQDDRYPQNGRISTTNWTPETVYRDIYTLPLANVPVGTYTLEVGFYNPDTNERLSVGERDSFSLRTLDLK